MKTPTNNLFRLIDAMSAAEKRYFKRHFSSDKSLQTKLFDFINGMEAYDEEQVKQHFSDTNLAKNLKVYKVQLFDLLMKSLTSYHSKRNINSRIRIGLEEIEILIDKQLYSSAQVRLKKIKELCIQHETYSKLFQILEFENQFKVHYSITPLPPTDELFAELEHAVDRTESYYRLQKILIELNSRKNAKGHHLLTPTEKQQYQQMLLQLQENYSLDDISLKEKSLWYQSISCIYDLLDEEDQSYAYKLEALSLFEAEPLKIESHSRLYFSALHNYLSCCNALKRYPELTEGIKKIKALAKRFPYLHRNMTFVYYLETRYYYRQAKFHSLTSTLENDILRHIRQYDLEGEHISVSLFLHYTLIHLILDDAKRVQFYLRRLQNNTGNMPAEFSQTHGIIELISHYETSDYFIINNLLLSYKRKLKKESEYTPYFKRLLDFFNQLGRQSKEEHAALAADFIKQQPSYSEDGVFRLLQGLHLEDWLLAVANNQSFAVWMEDKIVD